MIYLFATALAVGQVAQPALPIEAAGLDYRRDDFQGFGAYYDGPHRKCLILGRQFPVDGTLPTMTSGSRGLTFWDWRGYRSFEILLMSFPIQPESRNEPRGYRAAVTVERVKVPSGWVLVDETGNLDAALGPCVPPSDFWVTAGPSLVAQQRTRRDRKDAAALLSAWYLARRHKTLPHDHGSGLTDTKYTDWTATQVVESLGDAVRR